MCAQPRDEQQHDIGKGHPERDFQNPRRAARPVSMHVHLLSLRAVQSRFKRPFADLPAWLNRFVLLPMWVRGFASGDDGLKFNSGVNTGAAVAPLEIPPET